MAVRVPYTPGQIADTAVSSPAGSILVMMFLLAFLDWMRAGWSTDIFKRRRVMGYFLAGFGFLALSMVAPDVARAIVFGILLLTALGMAAPLASFLEDIAARINDRPAIAPGI